MILEYIDKAMDKAEFKILENGKYFGSIPDCPGVWAEGDTLSKCNKELREVLEEWILIKVSDGDPLPIIDKQKLEIVKEKVK